MQGSKVEMYSEVHPAIALVRDGIPILPPENEMPQKQMCVIRQFARATGELHPSLRNFDPSFYGPESIHE